MLALPFLLGIYLCSSWSPLFPLHALVLITLSLVKVRLLPTLTLSPHDLVLWTDGSGPFLLGKGGQAYLPTTLSMALRPLFPFQQAQYVQVFSRKPAPLCKFFARLDSTNKSATFHLFSYYALLHLSSYLKVLGRSGRNCILFLPILSFPSYSGYNGFPDTRFLQETMWLTSWPDGKRCLRPPQSLLVSLLLSLVSTLVFSRTGGVLSHQNSLTHRFPRFPPRNLCSLVTLAVFSIVYAATDTAYC